MGLDAIALFIIIGHVQQFQAEVGPLPTHHFRIETSYMDYYFLQGKHMTVVGTLQNMSIY